VWDPQNRPRRLLPLGCTLNRFYSAGSHTPALFNFYTTLSQKHNKKAVTHLLNGNDLYKIHYVKSIFFYLAGIDKTAFILYNQEKAT
jgi:hypothetical protein